MKVIPLTQGLFAKVDDSDYERLVNSGKWCAARIRNSVYAYNASLGYMHNFILGIKKVDHKDRDGLNNQRENLRQATDSQNAANRKHYITNKSGYRGVFYIEQTGTYRASISVGGVSKYLGTFKTAEEASKVYNEAAKNYFGEFANLSQGKRFDISEFV